MLDPRPDVTPVGTVYFRGSRSAGRGPTLVVKTRRDAPALLNSVRREIATINPQVPVFRERTMQEWIDLQLVGRRLPMLVASRLASSRCCSRRSASTACSPTASASAGASWVSAWRSADPPAACSGSCSATAPALSPPGWRSV